MLTESSIIAPTNLNGQILNPSRKIEGPILDAHFNSKFSPWFISGFTIAEGHFDNALIKNTKALANTGINFRFRLTCNYKDVALLCAIRNYFKTGTISKIRNDTDVVTLEICYIESIKN